MRLLCATTCVAMTACRLSVSSQARSLDTISRSDPFPAGTTRSLRAHQLAQETIKLKTIAGLEANASALNLDSEHEVAQAIEEERTNLPFESDTLLKVSADLKNLLAKHHPSQEDLDTKNLHDVIDKYVHEPNLDHWKSYVGNFKNSVSESNGAVFYDALIYYFGTKGFEKIMETLNIQKNGWETKPMEEQSGWLAGDISPEKIFTDFLMLNTKTVDEILNDPLLVYWIDYLQWFKQKHPNDETTIHETLKKVRNKDITTATAEVDPALALNNIYEQGLITDATPGKVLERLQLTDEYKDIKVFLASPDFPQWSAYMQHYNALHPESRTTLFETLSNNYDSNQIERYLYFLKKDWMTKKTSPADVYVTLELDKVDPARVLLLQLDTWIDYINWYCKNTEAKLADVLSDSMYYPKLVDMAYTGREHPFKGLTRNVLQELMKIWYRKDTSPTELFIHFGLDQDKVNIFEKPCFSLWLKYAEKFKRNKAKEIKEQALKKKNGTDQNPTALSRLKTFYSMKDLVDMYQQADLNKLQPLTQKFRKQFSNALDRTNVDHVEIIKKLVPAKFYHKMMGFKQKRLAGGTDSDTPAKKSKQSMISTDSQTSSTKKKRLGRPTDSQTPPKKRKTAP